MTHEMNPETPAAVPAPAYLQDIGRLAEQLQADIRLGLTSAEAQVRLTRDGPNELVTQPPIPAWKRKSNFSACLKASADITRSPGSTSACATYPPASISCQTRLVSLSPR